MLTGDAANADPVCDLSPHHHVVTEAVERARQPRVETKPIVFRDDHNSRRIAAGERKESA
jgi:pyrroloquinoline quinone biosynthesis protein E